MYQFVGVLLGLFLSSPSFSKDNATRNNAIGFESVYSEADSRPCIKIQLKVFLEGPMAIANSTDYRSTMRADLNTKRGLLPGQIPLNREVVPTQPGQPFNLPPWGYEGEEGSDWTDTDYDKVKQVHGVEVVDWVLVTLVEANAKRDKVLRAAAVVLENGTVLFDQNCFTQPSESGLYFLQLEHRNHMGVMTPNPIKLVDGILQYDFTTQDSYLDSPINPTGYGQKEVLPGTFAMFACDASQETDAPSYDVSAKDKIIWATENGKYDGYLSTDFDLDGDVNGFDKVLWNRNNGISSRVPR